MSEHLFQDLLVIDCASFIAGPAAATILADFGARVIKIEQPETGDGYRMLKHLRSMPSCDSNYPWTLTNRSKESLALDLKNAESRDVLNKLLARADVFITNYPLPVRDRLQLNYEDIRAVNPATIYASLTPYGETGPEAGNTGYDATAWWARSGLMDQIRASGDTPPAVSVPGMGDHMAACSLYGAIVTALYQRQKTGEGTKVSTSLMANGLWSNGIMVQAALDGARMGSAPDSSKFSAFTQVYRCSDDRWFVLTILPQAQEQAWPRLAACLGHPEWLEDERFNSADNREQHKQDLTKLLREAIGQQDWLHWNETFASQGITCGAIAKSSDHGLDAQVAAADALAEFDSGSGRTVNSPIFVEGLTKRKPKAAPEVGEHTEAILRELGLGH